MCSDGFRGWLVRFGGCVLVLVWLCLGFLI